MEGLIGWKSEMNVQEWCLVAPLAALIMVNSQGQ